MTCAEAPHLQRLQGCWEPTPKVFARYAEHEFTRCPVTYQNIRGIMLVRRVQGGEVDMRRGAAKQVEAAEYVTFLLKLRDANGDGT